MRCARKNSDDDDLSKYNAMTVMLIPMTMQCVERNTIVRGDDGMWRFWSGGGIW